MLNLRNNQLKNIYLQGPIPLMTFRASNSQGTKSDLPACGVWEWRLVRPLWRTLGVFCCPLLATQIIGWACPGLGELGGNVCPFGAGHSDL